MVCWEKKRERDKEGKREGGREEGKEGRRKGRREGLSFVQIAHFHDVNTPCMANFKLPKVSLNI